MTGFAGEYGSKMLLPSNFSVNFFRFRIENVIVSLSQKELVDGPMPEVVHHYRCENEIGIPVNIIN